MIYQPEPFDEESSLLPAMQESLKPKQLSRGAFLTMAVMALAAFLVGAQMFPYYYRPWTEPEKINPKKYASVRYYGFQIYTGGAPAFVEAENGRIRNPECMVFNSTHSTTYGQVPQDDGSMAMKCYVGHEDPIVDAKARLRIMRDALEAAHQEYTSAMKASSVDESRCLKIFVAPEFFFRGLTGAYEFLEDPARLDKIFGFNDTMGTDETLCDPERSPVCAILEGLQSMVQDKRFEDWLFLFGTVLATERFPADTMKNHSHDDHFEYLYYNFAPVYKGFDPKEVFDSDLLHHPAVGKRFLVNKRYVSTSDFLTPVRDVQKKSLDWQELFGPQPSSTQQSEWIAGYGKTPVMAVDNPRTYKHRQYDSDWFDAYKQELYEKAGYVQVEYDWLIIDGITLTIEVCLDHQLRTALDTFTGDLITGRTARIPSSGTGTDGKPYFDLVPIPTHQAHIGLVSSAGMTPAPESFALGQNGILLLQDGISNETAKMLWNEAVKETCGTAGLEFEGGTVAVRRRATVSKTDVRFEYELLSGSSCPLSTQASELCEHRLPIYKDWKHELSGKFSTQVYEPHLVVYGPVEIPNLE